jgi:uncharacterized protein YdiU (UPF0061 family)
MAPLFDNSYVQLPERFYARQAPVPVADPALIRVNHELAELLGIDPKWLESDEGINTIAGNRVPDGADPIATVYAGHQFGSFNPRLGDGRAILLGEVIGSDGERYDVQLKGSGITPFSRNGDGRAPLGPILREYLVSEAMAALGVATSRTLAAVTTGEGVYREQKLPGGVLIRVARSHIRIGTFQYFASTQDLDGLQLLIDHVIARHYPEALEADNRALSLFEKVSQQLAELIAHWQTVGFIHGVMNTDNMLLSGETIDFGPCAFMDGYNSAAVYSSIDQGSRYAYRNQPAITQWNLACLGQCLLPFIADDETEASEAAQVVLNAFPDFYMNAYFERMRGKFGLSKKQNEKQDDDEALMQEFLDLLESGHHDFTLAFRRLADIAADGNEVNELFDFTESFNPWIERWQKRCAQESVSAAQRQVQMRATNPVFIARNHLVEQAIADAYAGDFSFFHRLHERLQQPFTYDAQDAALATSPQAHEIVQQTFCGT